LSRTLIVDTSISQGTAASGAFRVCDTRSTKAGIGINTKENHVDARSGHLPANIAVGTILDTFLCTYISVRAFYAPAGVAIAVFQARAKQPARYGADFLNAVGGTVISYPQSWPNIYIS
jgi:hypothetical protein